MKRTEYGHSISFIAQDYEKYPAFTQGNVSFIGNADQSSSSTVAGNRKHIDRNTWESWGLIPSSRPTLPHPKQKTRYTDAPISVDGSIDLTFSMIPYPVYENREGSFTFIYNPIFQDLNNVCSEMDSNARWLYLYSEITKFIHGRRLRMVLEDDPEYYYEGLFWIENWTSNTDGTGSTITIGYNVEPYKISIISSIQLIQSEGRLIPPWLWDPFNFYRDRVNAIVHTDGQGNVIGDMDPLFSITINSYNHSPYSMPAQPSDINKNVWTDSTLNKEWNGLDLFELTGSKPQIPIIYWKPDLNYPNDPNDSLLYVNYNNSGYNIDYYNSFNSKCIDINGSYGVTGSKSTKGITRWTFNHGGIISIASDSMGEGYYKFTDIDMIFRDCDYSDSFFIRFIGRGNVLIDFHRGEL